MIQDRRISFIVYNPQQKKTQILKPLMDFMTTNHLIHESSPYLLQHASNPVNWYGWNKESLNKAKTENKPIFLSIGYSSCHWCHVMAHESFENPDIAKIMNQHFVNIKVDREERPDIDDIYQKSCQMATGQGGWPLSVFLTPDQKPFYVGTYFPILDSYGRPGFGSILRQLAQAWKEKPGDIIASAQKFVDNLDIQQKSQFVTNSDNVGDVATASTTTSVTTTTINKSVLDEAAINLLQLGDPTCGGFGSSPKFPNAANISFMFRYAKLSGISKFQEFALKTLNKMARGGIFDQIGGGFHRYSTDARWLVPHFEKMLYDNALVPINYVEAYQITKNPLYLETLCKTLDYVLREMTLYCTSKGCDVDSDSGSSSRNDDDCDNNNNNNNAMNAFYSAQDADSEGVEGKFYVWSKREVQEILGGDTPESTIFCLYYDVTDGGNWEGNTILCNNLDMSTIMFQSGLTEERIRGILHDCASKLLLARNKRVAPGLDDKVLTSWNALMITAFAKGYRVTHDDRYLQAAIRGTRFIDKNLTIKATKLYHTFKNGKSSIDGYLEDYAYYGNALLDVFEIDPNAKYLDQAQLFANYLLDHFWDDTYNTFFMTADNCSDETLIIRPHNVHDLSLPSGNSTAAHLLLRLYYMTQNTRYLCVCEKILHAQGPSAAENPFAFGYLLNVVYLYLKKPTEIVMLDSTVDRKPTLEIGKHYTPESVFISLKEQDQLERLQPIALFTGKKFGLGNVGNNNNNNICCFVCKNFSCSRELCSISEIKSHLD